MICSWITGIDDSSLLSPMTGRGRSLTQTGRTPGHFSHCGCRVSWNFKTRRKETETKPNPTQENLGQPEDILHELEGQIQLLKSKRLSPPFLELDQERQVLLLDVLVAQVYLTKDLMKGWSRRKAIQEQSWLLYTNVVRILEEVNVRIV